MNDEAVREKLAGVLLTACGDYSTGVSAPEVDLFDFYADALLPVVREIAAEELREAAEWLNGDPDKGGAPYIAGDSSVLFPHRLDIAEVVTWAAASLHDRADALTKPPDGPVR